MGVFPALWLGRQPVSFARNQAATASTLRVTRIRRAQQRLLQRDRIGVAEV